MDYKKWRFYAIRCKIQLDGDSHKFDDDILWSLFLHWSECGTMVIIAIELVETELYF